MVTPVLLGLKKEENFKISVKKLTKLLQNKIVREKMSSYMECRGREVSLHVFEGVSFNFEFINSHFQNFFEVFPIRSY
jgi:hypothetical protein